MKQQHFGPLFKKIFLQEGFPFPPPPHIWNQATKKRSQFPQTRSDGKLTLLFVTN